MKVKFTNKRVWRQFLAFLSVTSIIVTLVMTFVEIEVSIKYIIGGSYLGILIVAFFLIWIRANRMDKTTLKLNNSTINIYFGDIFAQTGRKVIAFNEYFDTVVDEKIISSKTLNGKYLNKYVTNTADLDKAICSDERLRDEQEGEDTGRHEGKSIRYKLGAIFENGEFFLLALTHFDRNNRANLVLRDYTQCLMNMWNEIDILYNGATVSMPLLGSGMTRMNDCKDISDQELLEIMLWTMKISKVKFTYPSVMNIVLNPDKKDKINLFRLKEIE